MTFLVRQRRRLRVALVVAVDEGSWPFLRTSFGFIKPNLHLSLPEQLRDLDWTFVFVLGLGLHLIPSPRSTRLCRTALALKLYVNLNRNPSLGKIWSTGVLGLVLDWRGSSCWREIPTWGRGPSLTFRSGVWGALEFFLCGGAVVVLLHVLLLSAVRLRAAAFLLCAVWQRPALFLHCAVDLHPADLWDFKVWLLPLVAWGEAMEFPKQSAEVVPSWDGNPRGWRRYQREVMWFCLGTKRAMRRFLAPRLISKLTGSARLLAMSWPQQEFAGKNGVSTLLQRLSQSPLVRKNLPNTQAILNQYFNYKRHQGESIANYLVRETLYTSRSSQSRWWLYTKSPWENQSICSRSLILHRRMSHLRIRRVRSRERRRMPIDKCRRRIRMRLDWIHLHPVENVVKKKFHLRGDLGENLQRELKLMDGWAIHSVLWTASFWSSFVVGGFELCFRPRT